MEGDRQSRIDALVFSALALEPGERESYLAEACVDEGIREEVTKTLALIDVGTPEIPIPQPPVGLGPVTSDDTRIGQSYGSYRVLRRVGIGGMGEVYLAYDSRLGRQVALKFLPTRTISDETLVQRFQGEARTASSLNHPNILTIFDVGKFGDDHFIASEFVEGVTLRSKLRRGTIDIHEAVEIITQVASALVAAHSAGVIHRDLKPTNIMLRPDGYVKVIDFGLAKRTQRRANGKDEAHTRPGTMVGTVDYMSPEQARGLDVDARTDLWSLGVVLYEMLAGRRPFEGKTEHHVVTSILDVEPRPPAQPGALPLELERVLTRCLQKDREKRYGSAAELQADLQDVRRALNLSGTMQTAITQLLRRRKRWLESIAAVTTLILIGGGWWWEAWGKSYFLGPELFQFADEVKQVTDNGRVGVTAISPDGRYLAFVSGTAHHRSLSVKQIDSSTESIRLGPADIEIEGITFSNDGQTIYYVDRVDEYGRLYKMPLTGGEPQVVASDVDSPVAINPLSQEMAFIRDKLGDSSVVLTGGALGQQQITALTTTNLGHRFAWSGRDNQLALFKYPPAQEHSPVRLEIFVPGREEALQVFDIPQWRGVSQPVWMKNGRDLIMPVATSYETDDRMQLREISSLTGRTRNLTNDIFGYKWISLTPDDNNLLTVRADVRTHFWIADGPQPTNGRSLSGDSGRYDSIGWTDGKKLIAQANRGAGIGIWLIDPSDGRKTMLTDPQITARGPSWLHGHDAVLFVSDRNGTSSLWQFSVGTGASQLLVQGQDYIESPVSSPDGNAVFYTSWKWDQCSIWMIPATDGSLKPQLLIPGARNGVVSPDGHLVALELAKEGRAGEPTTWRTAVFNLNSKTIVRELPEVRSGSKLRWFPDGTGLTYVVTDDQDTSNIWFQPLAGGDPKVLTSFQEEQIFDYNWSADGADFACLRGRKWSDAFLFRRKKSWIGKLFAQQ